MNQTFAYGIGIVFLAGAVMMTASLARDLIPAPVRGAARLVAGVCCLAAMGMAVVKFGPGLRFDPGMLNLQWFGAPAAPELAPRTIQRTGAAAVDLPLSTVQPSNVQRSNVPPSNVPPPPSIESPAPRQGATLRGKVKIREVSPEEAEALLQRVRDAAAKRALTEAPLKNEAP